MNVIYSIRSLKIAGTQTFGLLKAEGLAFIPIKVRLLLFGKYILFFFFCSLLRDTVRGCCWVLLGGSFTGVVSRYLL